MLDDENASGPFLAMDLDGYQGSFDKLWGYTNSVRLAAEHMDERGTIVLVSGTPARRSKPGQVALASVGGRGRSLCPSGGARVGATPHQCRVPRYH